MNKGIIIIFGKNDVDTTNNIVFKQFLNMKIKICLVNNGSHDKMLKLLKELKDSSKCDISILNLRKEKTSMLAVKAGVRFLSTLEDISIIIYTKPTTISNISLMEKIVNISDKELLNKKSERVLLRRVYSIKEIINC